MADTVRTIATDALYELGAYQPGETLKPEDATLALTRAQHMLDAWQASALTFARQARTVFTLLAGTSSVVVGTGQTVNVTRPMYIDGVNFLIPGTNPVVEKAIGLLDVDAYRMLSVKTLTSALPLQAFYQPNLTDLYGTLFFWPQVTQNLSIALYSPQGVDIPATLDTVLLGPPGYQEAFMYNLALRLAPAMGQDPKPALVTNAYRSMKVLEAPNVKPGMLSVDPALMTGAGTGYNVFTDSMAGRLR